MAQLSRKFLSRSDFANTNVDAVVSKHEKHPLESFLEGAAWDDLYIVASIDPAAGGEASQEPVIVFLISGSKSAILGSLLFTRQDLTAYMLFAFWIQAYMPQMLQALQQIRTRIQGIMERKTGRRVTSHIPVMLVIENNFGYGPIVYHNQLVSQNQTLTQDIFIATPVYIKAGEHALTRIEQMKIEDERRDVREKLTDAIARFHEEWKRGGVREGFNRERLIRAVRGAVVDMVSKSIDNDTTLPDAKDVIAAVTQPQQYDRMVAAGGLELAAALIKKLELGNRIAMSMRAYGKNHKDGDDAAVDGSVRLPYVFETMPGHSVHDGEVQFDEISLLNSAKTRWGVTTTDTSKRNSYLQIFLGATYPGRTHLPVIICDDKQLVDADCRQWHDATWTMTLVYQQWLDSIGIVGVANAKVHTSGVPRVDKVIGKFKGAFDDTYMAYTIGLHWVTQFTQYLPGQDDRQRLLWYMKDVNNLASRSATYLDTKDRNEVDTQYTKKESCAVCAYFRASHTPHTAANNAPCRAPIAMTDQKINTLEAVILAAAWFRCMRRLSKRIVYQCRRLWLAVLLSDTYQEPASSRLGLEAFRVRRYKAHNATNNFWKQNTTKTIIQTRGGQHTVIAGGELSASEMRQVEEMGRQQRQQLRIYDLSQKGRPFPYVGTPVRTLIEFFDHCNAIAKRAQKLFEDGRAASGWLKTHPIWKNENATDAMLFALQRVTYSISNLKSIIPTMTQATTRTTSMTHKTADLNKRVYEKLNPVSLPPVPEDDSAQEDEVVEEEEEQEEEEEMDIDIDIDVETDGDVSSDGEIDAANDTDASAPHDTVTAPFKGFVMELIDLGRTMESFERRETAALHEFNAYQWSPHDIVAHGVGCKRIEYDFVDWRGIYKTLFPIAYERKIEQADPTHFVYIYSSRFRIDTD